MGGQVMAEYDWVTGKMFAEKLEQLVQEDLDTYGGRAANWLLSQFPAVYDALRDEYNNDVLGALEEERDDGC